MEEVSFFTIATSFRAKFTFPNKLFSVSKLSSVLLLISKLLFKTSVIESSENDLPGIVQKRSKNELIISTGKGCLSLTEIQQDGKKRLLIAEFLRGCTVSVGDKFI